MLYGVTYGIYTNTPGPSRTGDGTKAGGVVIVRNNYYAPGANGICIGSPGANRIEENTCHGGWAGLDLSDGANLYSKNFLFQNVVAIVNGGLPNIDGGTIDPALSNVIVPIAP